MCDSAGGTDCHEDIFDGIVKSETCLQRICDCLTDGWDSEALAVAVQSDRIGVPDQIDQSIAERLRCRNAWIAKAVVEYILVADFLCALRAIVKQLANSGFLTCHIEEML